jgi:hypothetical protein
MQTSMPRVGFERTAPMFKLTKTFYTLDRAATVVGAVCVSVLQY